MSVSELDAAVESLKFARRNADETTQTVQDLEAALAKTGLGQDLESARAVLREAKITEEQAEETVRGLAVGLYNIDKCTRPHPFVQVRVYHRLEYNRLAAYRWCVQHGSICLQLDEAKFEKVAVETDAPVTVVEEPRAFIAREL